MQRITKKQVLASDDNELFVQYLANNNQKEYNYLKALEECSEFTEVLCKLQTKPDKGTSRPDEYSLITEFADLNFRGTVALLSFFTELSIEELHEKMQEHTLDKLEKLRKNLAKGKYNGKL